MEAEATPFPSPEQTPPVTKMYLLTGIGFYYKEGIVSTGGAAAGGQSAESHRVPCATYTISSWLLGEGLGGSTTRMSFFRFQRTNGRRASIWERLT